MIDLPRWSSAELEGQRQKSIALFREERMGESLVAYLSYLEVFQGTVQTLLERTADLRDLAELAEAILTDADQREAFRFLAGPPISSDDLKTLAEATFSRSAFQEDPGMVERVVGTIERGLDRRRFPWVSEGRAPTEAERSAAVLATAVLLAWRKAQTARRHEGKNLQEEQVALALSETLGFKEVEIPSRTLDTLAQAPGPGHFCRENQLGTRKADFIVGLWDTRTMPIECKVSNSAVNSVKRLNNDAAVKAEVWRKDFGKRQVVPVAILSGVYKLHNLLDAQDRGLTLFWAHDLTAMNDWIAKTGV